MKKFKHLSFDQRKIISSGISHGRKLCEIAATIDFDPTSISKEVKRNRTPINLDSSKPCPKLFHWPFVCSNCNKRYEFCGFQKFKYNVSFAQNLANDNLINSRKGINLSDIELHNLDLTIKTGVSSGKSLYQIKHESDIPLSIPTLYRYVHNGIVSTKPIDLPFVVKCKKRKHKSQYLYKNNKIDRSGHKYIDFIAYMKSHPFSNIWQLDFLGNLKYDTKYILSLIMPDIQFPLLFLIDKPNSDKIVNLFNTLEENLSPKIFKEIFQVILTDRDPSFSNFDGIISSIDNNSSRCQLFYCDPYVSTQKPNVENLNKQLRRFFPKSLSTSSLTQEKIKSVNLQLINTYKKSLDDDTPKNAFIKIFGMKSLNDLLNI